MRRSSALGQDTQPSELNFDSWDGNNLQALSLTEKDTAPTTTNKDSDRDSLTGHNNQNALVVKGDTLEGIWQSDGYGYVAEAKGNKLDVYSVTKNSDLPLLTATNVDKTPGDGQRDL